MCLQYSIDVIMGMKPNRFLWQNNRTSEDDTTRNILQLFTKVFVHTYIYTRTHINTYASTHTLSHTLTCTHTHTHKQTQTNTQTKTQTTQHNDSPVRGSCARISGCPFPRTDRGDCPESCAGLLKNRSLGFSDCPPQIIRKKDMLRSHSDMLRSPSPIS